MMVTGIEKVVLIKYILNVIYFGWDLKFCFLFVLVIVMFYLKFIFFILVKM